MVKTIRIRTNGSVNIEYDNGERKDIDLLLPLVKELVTSCQVDSNTIIETAFRDVKFIDWYDIQEQDKKEI